jgi:hypothetical protein
MVVNTPTGKRVDTGKLALALAGANASMHERIKRLEAGMPTRSEEPIPERWERGGY